jgi:hypothetical protein
LALARSLLLADAVTPTALAEALFLSATRGTSLVRTLLAARAIDTLRLEQMLERGEAPYMRHIAPVPALLQRLPPGLCDRLLAMPVRHDPRTGTVDVAVVDARDPHPAEEIGYWLRAPVRMVRTSIASMESALLRLGERIEGDPDLGMRPLAPPIWAPPPAPVPHHLTRTPMYGMPAAPGRPRSDPPPDDPELAIPLTRRNLGTPPVPNVTLDNSLAPEVDIGPPAIERVHEPAPTRTARRESDPVLDLRRRKPASAPNLPPAAPESATVVDQMLEAHDRDQILDLLVAGTRPFARRAVVLAVRRESLIGWTGTGEIPDRAILRAVRLPNVAPTVFHEMLEHAQPQPVRVPVDAAHAPLLAVMRPPIGPEIVVASIQAEGRAVGIVFADGLADTAFAMDRLGTLARAAGDALGRLLRDRRA